MEDADGSTASLRLVLYARSYCHLCDEMLAALNARHGEFDFVVDVVDVDSDPVLEQRFGNLVPVLVRADMELCHYHLDLGKVRAHLTKIH